MKFNVRVRIVTPMRHAIHEVQVYDAPTALEAMKKAQADAKNTSRGGVSTQGADPLPAEDEVKAKKIGRPAMSGGND